MNERRVDNALRGLEELSGQMERAQEGTLNVNVARRWAGSMDTFINALREEFRVEQGDLADRGG